MTEAGEARPFIGAQENDLNVDKFFNTAGGQRGEWEFEYTAGKVAEGAAAQRAFRQGRAQAWTDKKAEVMAKIRESGVHISESLADQMSSQMAAYQSTRSASGPQITIDAELQRHLAEAHQKIDHHTTLAAEYDGWVQVLSANAEQRVKLTQADWLYFFGKV